MGKRSNIVLLSKVSKGISLKDVALPGPLKTTERSAPKKYTKEDLLFTKLVETNPALLKLVKAFDLVGEETGVELKLVDVESYKAKFYSLAGKVLSGEERLTKEDLIVRICQRLDISKERALSGLDMMLLSKVILRGEANLYYLVNRVNKVS